MGETKPAFSVILSEAIFGRANPWAVLPPPFWQE